VLGTDAKRLHIRPEVQPAAGGLIARLAREGPTNQEMLSAEAADRMLVCRALFVTPVRITYRSCRKLREWT
jgi:hypothetical protein